MSKTTVMISIGGTIAVTLSAISLMAGQSDFSGTWALDKARTHGLPHTLKNYNMVVTQNGKELIVETKVNGDAGNPQSTESVESASPHATGPKSGGYLNATTTTSALSAGTLALAVINPRVAYSLDGEETTAEWGALSGAVAKLKARWSKDGKTLELSLVQQEAGGQHRTLLTSRERWTLSADGEFLKAQRSVSAPEGSDGIVLVFRKGPTASPALQP